MTAFLTITSISSQVNVTGSGAAPSVFEVDPDRVALVSELMIILEVIEYFVNRLITDNIPHFLKHGTNDSNNTLHNICPSVIYKLFDLHQRFL